MKELNAPVTCICIISLKSLQNYRNTKNLKKEEENTTKISHLTIYIPAETNHLNRKI